MLKQILKINQKYYENIIILDNCSDCQDTVEFLKKTDCKIIFNNSNSGPWVTPRRNSHIYNQMPSKFILTDPDLEINENIPCNFIDVMSSLSEKYNSSKIGFALNIEDFDKMYQDNNYAGSGKSIYEWESVFWQKKIEDSSYEIYQAPIDTTFCLINKNYFDDPDNRHFRIAGNFTAKHLPWYVNNKIYNIYGNYVLNKKTTSISTISRTISSYIESNFLNIKKNNEIFLIKNENSNPNINFWKNTYTNWETETFSLLDKLLNKNKVFIDIGGWVGTTAMYGSRKSKHVYSVEADIESCRDMSINLQNNCDRNYTLINKAVYHTDDKEVKFGKNKFLPNAKLNDSTSQILEPSESLGDSYSIKTVTLNTILKDYNIDPNEISLVKVDIEGAEELVLSDLYTLHKNYNIPIYVSFHFHWWKDQNLDRFDFLIQEQKRKIALNPLASVLFI